MKNIILVIVSLSMFMEAIDATVLNTAIPAMAESLHVNPIDLKIALITYLLSLAIFIPISGWIADKFGVKKVFMLAIGVFTLSSIWCGLTHSLSGLIVGRMLQGLGGSFTMPVARLIIVRICERHELISKMSIVVMVGAMGLMLGPVLGGVITTHISWRWIFWINIPIGIIAIISAYVFFPPMPKRAVPELDKLGFLLFGSGLATLSFSMSLFSESHMDQLLAFYLLIVSILLLLLYGLHSRKVEHPIVKVQLLQQRTFRTSVVGNVFSRMGFGGVPFLVPLFLQIVLGYSAQLSGFLLAPTALGVLFVKPLSLSILRFFGYKNLLSLNTFLVGLCLISFGLINLHTSIYTIAFLTFLYGFLISLQYTGMNSLAYATISQEDYSSATSIMSTVQQLGQSFGVALAAILIRIFESLTNTKILSEPIFQYTFITMGILTFIASIVFFYLKSTDGFELLGVSRKRAL